MADHYQTGVRYLKGQMLVATPQMAHTMWEQTVIYLAEHTSKGAIGFVLNRPSRTPVNKLISELDYVSTPEFPETIYLGGPVKERNIYMLHSSEWYSASTTPISKDISWSLDDFMLEKMCMGDTPREWTMFAGHSGWAPGQLESEIARGSWLTIDARPATVFATKTSELWSIGVEIAGQEMINTYF